MRRRRLARVNTLDILFVLPPGQTDHVLLALSPEMGPCFWVSRNPRHGFHRHGSFNPRPFLRRQRVLQVHFMLLEHVALPAFNAAR